MVNGLVEASAEALLFDGNADGDGVDCDGLVEPWTKEESGAVELDFAEGLVSSKEDNAALLGDRTADELAEGKG